MKYIVLLTLLLTSSVFASDLDEIFDNALKGDLVATFRMPEVFKNKLQKAKLGEASSQNKVGIMFSLGLGVSKDSQAAIHWFSKAADQEDLVQKLKANIFLAHIYKTGDGVPEDDAGAIGWYMVGANNGFATAQVGLGNIYNSQNNVEEAFIWYRKAADKGYELAEYIVGLSYAAGLGVPENDAEAVKWFKKAADQGNGKAQSHLGDMHHKGAGVPENYAEAVRWYRKAADQGIAGAQYNLGSMYDKGDGAPENGAEAVKWFRKAADQGMAAAQFNLGNMYANGKGVPENNTRAYAWWSMAKTQGHTSAANNIDILKPMMTTQQIADGQALATKCYESNYKDCD